eukprot:TRINITY_DN7853_c0_g1_i7.p1 TRINITY_DN7853_c0_g1~~TRINITY_DN7853_c0_g1_i7.p1  ORF type:complete len:253 (-),score=33.89 TRINITY_DN7853_c0_g1_i7:128-886(-)
MCIRDRVSTQSTWGAFEEGNTVSFETFKLYLKEEFPRLALDFDSQMVPRMKDLMIDTFLSVKGVLNPMRRRNCFELLGFDFLIDEDFRIWLIEVNTNPYLGIPNPLIEGIMPKMLNDLFELVLDPYLHPLNPLPKRESANAFELLYCEKKGINQRRSFASSLYPLPELTPPLNITISPSLPLTRLSPFKEMHTVEIQLKKDTPQKQISVQERKDLLISRKTPIISEVKPQSCLLYTSPSPRDLSTSRMPSSA